MDGASECLTLLTFLQTLNQTYTFQPLALVTKSKLIAMMVDILPELDKEHKIFCFQTQLEVKRVLRFHKYPPDDQPRAVETVIEQAEMFAEELV